MLVRPSITRLAAIVMAAFASVSVAQIDNLKTLVATDPAAGSDVILAAAYDPVSDTAYTSVSILSGAGNGAMLRRITGVSTANPVSITVLDRDQFSYFTRDGDLTRTLRSSSIAGMTFNPAPVGSIGTRGSLWFVDSGITRLPNGSTTTDPVATKRVYRYNLGDVPAPGNDYASVSSVFTPMVSMANIQTAAGVAVSTADTGLSRQLTFSPDGQNLYGVDSSANTGGIYRINPISGSIVRILSAPSTPGCEPAVVRLGAIDRIYYRSASNLGGISYVDHDPVTNTTSAASVLFDAATLKDFMQTGTDPVVSNLTSDSAGNLYFFDGFGQSGNYRLLKYDTQGRLSKVTTRAERDQFFTGTIGDTYEPSVQLYKMQSYSRNDPSAGTVTEISYVEASPIIAVAAVTAYKPADFNRDGVENAADLSLFRTKVTANGVTSAIDEARFDLNGNRSIDFHDVMTLRTYINFRLGDADLSQRVDFDDLLTLAQNYGAISGGYWTVGDFTGDGAIDFDDLLTLAQNYGVPLISGSFEGDWQIARSLVPEPLSLPLFASVLPAWLRQRR